MKACVFSDSHGYAANMIAFIGIEKPDIVFFLGDGERDLLEVEERFPDLPIYAVRGNCDFRSELNTTLVCEVEGVTIYMTHGHTANVKYEDRMDTLTMHAMQAGADIALFGHTHWQHLSENRGVILLNPGSVGRGYLPGYAVLIIENGRVFPSLKGSG